MNLNKWIGEVNKRQMKRNAISARIDQAKRMVMRTVEREERWGRIGESVKAELPGWRIVAHNYGIYIDVDTLHELHAVRAALKKAIPDYTDKITSVDPVHRGRYTVAEIIEMDGGIRIKYRYNGPDSFYGGTEITLTLPYSKVPESIFNGGKCGLKDTVEPEYKSVRFACDV